MGRNRKKKTKKLSMGSISEVSENTQKLQKISNLYKQKKFDEMAGFLAQCDLHDAQGEFANLQALCSHAQGEYASSAKAASLAVSLQPDKLDFKINLAVCLAKNEQKDEALVIYREILKKNPEDSRVYRNMGALFYERADYELALICYKKLLDLGQKNSLSARSIASCYLNLGNISKAVEYCERAISDGKDLGESWHLLARIFQSKGDKDGARQAYRLALESEPRLFGSYSHYVELGGQKEDELKNIVQRLKGFLAAGGLSLQELRFIHFALGKVFHHLHDFDLAFKHFELGNKYRSKSIGGGYSLDNFRKNYQWFSNNIDNTFFVRTRGPSSSAEQPVFIVGMPRTGTTLLEQLIASHPACAGAGELSTIGAIVTDIQRSHKNLTEAYKEKIDNLSVKQLEQYALQYLVTLKRYDSEASRIVDKMPQNFLHLWLIGLLFPNAPILYCVRDVRATCLSCFMNDFSTGHFYKADLETLGRYYTLAEKWMELWQEVVPNPILTVNYENLVTHQEETMHNVFNHLQVKWNPDFLDVRNRRHFSLTSSNLQIRDGVYTAGLKSWEKYADHLGPLIKGLEAEQAAWAQAV